MNVTLLARSGPTPPPGLAGIPMHPALFKLFALSTRAALRRTLRGARTVRGALLLLFTLGFVALTVGPSIASAILLNGRPDTAPLAGALEPSVPLLLLVFCLLFVVTSAGE